MKRTQRDMVMDMLRVAGASGITDDDARYLAKCNRLAARVYDLRREGFDIRSVDVPGESWCRYVLHEHPTQMRWGVES